ncbi:MAG: LPP20 family lipoprotein [Candidatus Marinimicrobia bacterium]|nr:LPP20 family lipoprotein [Candidatus Neomarinimicrobiota bacterium]
MRIIVPLIVLLFISCSNHPEPGWISDQPHADNYWFGVGSVEKPFYGSDIREEARSKALSEIASQISVEVSGTFEQVIKERNLDLDEYAKSVVKTRVEHNLPNIEIVDAYESKNRYFLLARLSQKTYYETIEKKRRNAVITALELLERAEAEFTVQSFTSLSEAMNEISPYLDVPIMEEYPRGSGKFINLYSTIKLSAITLINRLKLVPDENVTEIKLGLTRDVKLTVRIIDNKTKTPFLNIPIYGNVLENNSGGLVLSDENGYCTFSLPNLNGKTAIQYMNYEVETDNLIGESSLFGNLPNIHAQSIIKVIPPNILVQIKEYNLGEETGNPYIAPVIMDFFATQFSANFIESNNGDFIIKGTVNTRSVSDKPNDYGIYQTFADATISISKGGTGEKLIEKSFNKIQGSDFNSKTESANQALKKLSEKITIEFLPELSEILKGL